LERHIENIAFAIVLRVKKIAKISKTASKAMVNAHVIHVGIFLVGCQVFGDFLDPIGMPTFFVCLSVNNGDTIRYG
jgi:hypothetical protein